MNQTPTQRDPVVLAQAQHIVRGLYRGLLARDPEPAGLDYWSGVILAGGDAGAVLNALTQSDEFKALSAPLARRDAVRAELDATRAALEDRKVIDRAKGIVMRARNIPEEQAYALMRRSAMEKGRKIAEIARAIVTAAEVLK